MDHWFEGRAIISAKLGICGLEVAVNAPRFTEVEFQVGGLTELAGTQPIAQTYWPTEEAGDDQRFAMQWRPDFEQSWTMNNDTITLAFHRSARLLDPYQFSITTSPVVTVTGPPKTFHEWRQQYIDPIQSLTSIATSTNQPYSWATVARTEEVRLPDGSTRERTARAQVFGSEFNQEAYLAKRPDTLRPMLIRLGSSDVSLAEMISAWRLSAGQPVQPQQLASNKRHPSRGSPLQDPVPRHTVSTLTREEWA